MYIYTYVSISALYINIYIFQKNYKLKINLLYSLMIEIMYVMKYYVYNSISSIFLLL